jgi:hypothetical protein
MLNLKLRVLTIACAFAAAALLYAGTSFAQCASCAAHAYAAPAVSYQAYYAPAAVTAYQPVAACNSCVGSPVAYGVGYGAVTTYRPLWGGWTTRLVPYSTYRPVYASPVAYASYYAPCASCSSTVAYSPVVTYSPCTSCSPCSSCSPCAGGCATGTCGTTAGCASCAAATTTTYSNETPAPAAPQRTFREEQTQKPAIENTIKPQPDSQLNSMPMPTLQDPRDRVTSRPTYTAPRMELTAQRVQTAPVKDDGGWQASKD